MAHTAGHKVHGHRGAVDVDEGGGDVEAGADEGGGSGAGPLVAAIFHVTALARVACARGLGASPLAPGVLGTSMRWGVLHRVGGHRLRSCPRMGTS